MLELQLRDIGTPLSGEEEVPCATGTPIVEVHPWADSSYDLQRGLEVVELGAPPLPPGVDVAFGHVVTEPLSHQHHADEDPE